MSVSGSLALPPGLRLFTLPHSVLSSGVSRPAGRARRGQGDGYGGSPRTGTGSAAAGPWGPLGLASIYRGSVRS